MYQSIEELQQNLYELMKNYNNERTHQARSLKEHTSGYFTGRKTSLGRIEINPDLSWQTRIKIRDCQAILHMNIWSDFLIGNIDFE